MGPPAGGIDWKPWLCNIFRREAWVTGPPSPCSSAKRWNTTLRHQTSPLGMRQRWGGAIPLKGGRFWGPLILNASPTAQSHELTRVQGIQEPSSPVCSVVVFRYDPPGWRSWILAYFGIAVDEDFFYALLRGPVAMRSILWEQYISYTSEYISMRK